MGFGWTAQVARRWVVPPSAEKPQVDAKAESTAPKSRLICRPRISWAEMLRKFYASDVLPGRWCGGRMRPLAAITARPVVKRILTHLGLPVGPPVMAPATSI